MERLFVKILNVTLLVGGFLALATTIITLGFAALSLLPTMLTDASNANIRIHYKPASEISGSVKTTSGNNAEDPELHTELGEAAKELCKARSDFIARISNNQLEAAEDCASQAVEATGENWGDRAQNFLEESTAYWRAILSDPQMRTKYSSSDETSVNGYLEQIDREISDHFQKEVLKDEKRRQIAEAKIETGRAGALLSGSVAAWAFMSFLFIAFLIVATRIEKHLGNIEKKTPEPSTP